MATQTNETKNTSCNASNPFAWAFDCMNSAVEAGVKFQQDAFKTMSETFNKSVAGDQPFANVRQRFETATRDGLAAAKVQVETGCKLVEETAKNGFNLMNHVVETVAGKAADRNPMQNASAVWQQTIETVKNNTQAVSRAQAATVDNMTSLMNRSANPFEPVSNS